MSYSNVPSRYLETTRQQYYLNPQPTKTVYRKRLTRPPEDDDPSLELSWKALIAKRKKCKAQMKSLKEELDTATRALINIDKRRYDNPDLFNPPSLSKSVHCGIKYQSFPLLPKSKLETRFATRSYVYENDCKVDCNIRSIEIPRAQGLKGRKIVQSAQIAVIQEPPMSLEFLNKPVLLSSLNFVKASIRIMCTKKSFTSFDCIPFENLLQFERQPIYKFGKAQFTKEESNLLTIVYHWTEVFFCVNQNKKHPPAQEKAIPEIHLLEEFHSFDLISSKCPFEIVDDSGIDEDEEDWEYYSEDDEPSIKKQTTYPRIPASLLERWNTSIWASDDEDSESDYYSSEEEEEYYEEFDLTDDRLLKWISNLNKIEDSKFLKNMTAERKKPLKYRKTTKSKCITEYVYDPEGTTCGYYREFTNGQFDTFGTCETKMEAKKKPSPVKLKTIWLKLKGNSYCFYGSNQSFYLYPDLTTAILGTFDASGQLKDFGTYGQVSSLNKVNDLWIPVIKPIDDLQKIFYDPATSVVISQNPLLRDPYEKSTVSVYQSKIPYAGEGLYTKRSVQPNTLLALFNGVKRREATSHRGQWSLTTSEYRIALKRDVALDIPPGNASLSKYCATLGHKCCHSFTPNSAFEEIYHPRFGHIMSIVSIKDIRIGEEITVCYNYDLSRAPVWYRDAWFHYLRETEELNEEELQSIANKKSQEWGVIVDVPPPPRTSSRFISCGICSNHVGLREWTLSCKQCELWYHFSCIDDVNVEDFEKASKSDEGLDWKCSKC